MSTLPVSRIEPGLLILHSHRAERLAETVAGWLARTPLSPLEEEVVLVQSNGMAEWLKMTLAEQMGVCAAARVELPGRFQWRTYRQVLGWQQVPAVSPFDKTPLTWRLVRRLPSLLGQPGFEPLAGFMAGGEPERLLQLAMQLADLLDQYQVYRADWLEDWAEGRDQLLRANGERVDVPPDQRWQPALWRALLAPLDDTERLSLRPRLHRRVLARLQGGGEDGAAAADPEDGSRWRGLLPRRVVLFGMTHVPLPLLELLVALARHSQVLLAVPNPCRFHWADIMDGRELLRQRTAVQRRRQPLRGGRDLAEVPLDEMHVHAHPLLAAWGRQGRDFVRQLDAFDNSEQTLTLWGGAAELPRLDLFDDEDDDDEASASPPSRPLLAQVQARIRDLVPLAEHAELAAAAPLEPDDRSIVFHTAHSALREVEVLHDQLLHLLAAAPAPGRPALAPRDIVVMMPDVASFEPAIRAVFGQYARHDPRYIPFDVADLNARHGSPLLVALEWLLRLPQQRCTFSELRDLLDVPALARRFGLDEDDLPQLTRWMAGAGLHWGLDAGQRASLGLAACGELATQHWALQRMLLGFASGGAPAGPVGASPVFDGLEPYAEIGGLEAGLVGSLAQLHERLLHWWTLLAQDATPAQWAERGRALLADFFEAVDESDRALLAALDEALSTWLDAWLQAETVLPAEAGSDQASAPDLLPLAVARQAWLDALDEPQLNRRFRAGGVTFCTLMPMRAIPFEVVCLLGMNEGDYPRRAPRSDFDLLAQPGQARPGDRARRDDDRQLMLEALLSARRTLYLSWTGRSVRDNTLQPPSVLVAQLRDYLQAGWGLQVLGARSFEHPLQPFSRQYFEPGSALVTYAREWRQAHDPVPEPEQGAAVPDRTPGPEAATQPLTTLSLDQLAAFLRNPVRSHFRHRLGVVFEDEATLGVDEEVFALAGLDAYAAMDELLQTALAGLGDPADPGHSAPDLARCARASVQILRRRGRLPLGAWGDLSEMELVQTLQTLLTAWWQLLRAHPLPVEHLGLRLEQAGVVLQDGLDGLRQGLDRGPAVWCRLTAGRLLQDGDPTRPRLPALLPAWLHSLAAAACGTPVIVAWLGRDATCLAHPPDPDEARQTLQVLLAGWSAGQAAPLPVAIGTALAWLASGDGTAAFEGGFALPGEGREPCLARLFADYAALCEDGQFPVWAEQLYAPLLAWSQAALEIHPHSLQDTP